MSYFCFFLVFSCFAGNEGEGWFSRAWSHVKLGVSRFAGNLSDCIRDEDTVLGPVYCVGNKAKDAVVNTVCEKAYYWWWNRSRCAKTSDVFIATMFVMCAAVVINGMTPPNNEGMLYIYPGCVCHSKRCCSVGDFVMCLCRAYPVAVTGYSSGKFVLKNGFSAAKKAVGFSASCAKDFMVDVVDAVVDGVLEAHKLYGD